MKASQKTARNPDKIRPPRVSVYSRLKKGTLPMQRWEREAKACLQGMRSAGCDLGLVFCGDRLIRQLNRRYRGQDRPTDVLAFPMASSPTSPTPFLGEVIISIPTARRQARQEGHSLEREVAALLVHGILHLHGYDHNEEKDARRMRREELRLLGWIGSARRRGL
jgi:probable rRNA maturation factor